MAKSFEEYERERVERARQQRAASRAARTQRLKNPAAADAPSRPVGGFPRTPEIAPSFGGGEVSTIDTYRAQVALRIAERTRMATNQHRAQLGLGTESFDDTELRAKRMAARWKRLGVGQEELAFINDMSVAELQAEGREAEARISGAGDRFAQSEQAAAEPILYHG